MHVSSSPLTPGTLFQTSKSPVVHTSVMLVNILFKVLSSGYHHGIADGVMVLSSTLMGGVVSIHFAGFQVIRRFLKTFINDREKEEVLFNRSFNVYS